jgi:hypothetical protein
VSNRSGTNAVEVGWNSTLRLESNVREAYLSEQPVAVESSDREHA